MNEIKKTKLRIDDYSKEELPIKPSRFKYTIPYLIT